MICSARHVLHPTSRWLSSSAAATNRCFTQSPVFTAARHSRAVAAAAMAAAADGDAAARGGSSSSGAAAPPPPPSPLPPRVLSVQSHVVSGYVGNKCAALPLQLLGFDVDAVMSCQLSNHTGYPSFRGKAFDGAHLDELVAGLAANGLVRHTHLLTGYIGTASMLEAVAGAARALRAANPELTYVCDPVLGDEGRCYVSEELVEAYRRTILPLASVLTPNQFEAELLSGARVTDEASALAACDALHAAGPHTVVITSAEWAASGGSPEAGGSGAEAAGGSSPEAGGSGGGEAGGSSTEEGGGGGGGGEAGGAESGGGGSGKFITLVASTRLPQLPGSPAALRVRIPKLDAYFTGTGDLLAALLLAWTARHPGDLAAAVERAVAGLQGVLRVTAAAATAEASGGAAAAADSPAAAAAVLGGRERTAAAFRARELRLVQAQREVVEPKVVLRAEAIAR